MQISFVIATVLTLSTAILGCATNWKESADSWKGQNLDDLIVRWGPPDSIYRASDGRRTALFRHSRLYQGTELYCNVRFTTDVKGQIESSAVEGNIGGCNRFFADKPRP